MNWDILPKPWSARNLAELSRSYFKSSPCLAAGVADLVQLIHIFTYLLALLVGFGQDTHYRILLQFPKVNNLFRCRNQGGSATFVALPP